MTADTVVEGALAGGVGRNDGGGQAIRLPTPAFAVGGDNPLLSAALPLLALAARLRHAAHADPVRIRADVAAEVERFAAGAEARGARAESIRFARFALVATIDDLAAAAVWGGGGVFGEGGLVAAVLGEPPAPNRFFELVTLMLAQPARHRSELEVVAACLDLGYEGEFRSHPHSQRELNALREHLHRDQRRRRSRRRPLSPPRPKPPKPRSRRIEVPVWVIGALLGVAVMALFVGLRYTLADASAPVYLRLVEAVPARPVTIVGSGTPALSDSPRYDPVRLERLREALASDIANGTIEVMEGDDGIRLRTAGRGLFATASATLVEANAGVLDRLAAALARENGTVVVVGHTDSTPIRSVRFPSNLELSLARAQAVEDRLSRTLGRRIILSAEGRGDAEPLVSNATREGREKNRRIEFLFAPGNETR